MTMKYSHSGSKSKDIRVEIPGFTDDNKKGLFFLMAAALWPAVDALGQVNGDFNNYFSWPVSLVSSTGKHLNGHDAEYAVDGNSETWMETASDQGVRLMVKNVEEKPIKRLVFDLGGNESKRATEIKIESMMLFIH